MGTVALTGNTIYVDGTEQTGTATGGSVNTVEDSGAGWTVDAYAGRGVRFTSGTNNGRTRRITSNTADTLTLDHDLPDAVTTEDFEIAMNWADVQAQNDSSAWGRVETDGQNIAVGAGTRTDFRVGNGATTYFQDFDLSITIQFPNNGWSGGGSNADWFQTRSNAAFYDGQPDSLGNFYNPCSYMLDFSDEVAEGINLLNDFFSNYSFRWQMYGTRWRALFHANIVWSTLRLKSSSVAYLYDITASNCPQFFLGGSGQVRRFFGGPSVIAGAVSIVNGFDIAQVDITGATVGVGPPYNGVLEDWRVFQSPYIWYNGHDGANDAGYMRNCSVTADDSRRISQYPENTGPSYLPTSGNTGKLVEQLSVGVHIVDDQATPANVDNAQVYLEDVNAVEVINEDTISTGKMINGEKWVSTQEIDGHRESSTQPDGQYRIASSAYRLQGPHMLRVRKSGHLETVLTLNIDQPMRDTQFVLPLHPVVPHVTAITDADYTFNHTTGLVTITDDQDEYGLLLYGIHNLALSANMQYPNYLFPLSPTTRRIEYDVTCDPGVGSMTVRNHNGLTGDSSAKTWDLDGNTLSLRNGAIWEPGIQNGTLDVDSDSASNWPPLEDVTIDFQDAGTTYDLQGVTVAGTLTLVNSSGGAVTVKVDDTVTVVNTGPNITVDTTYDVTITVLGIEPNSEIALHADDGVFPNLGTEVDHLESAGGGATLSYVYSGTARNFDLVVIKAGYRYVRQVINGAGKTAFSVTVSHVVDRSYSNPP